MSLQPSKYKILTKQVYNHLVDEHDDSDMSVNLIMHHINSDELLQLLLKKLTRSEKVKIGFMVYFFSSTKDLDSSFSKVDGNLVYLEIFQYSDLGPRDEECHECHGSGSEHCSDCDGSGNVECYNCGGSGEDECDECGGSGEDDEGDPCNGCHGGGKVNCNVCDSDGEIECRECGGYGSVECSYCDGSGFYESNDEYWDESEINYYSLNRDLANLPEETFLTEEQINSIFSSKPNYTQVTKVNEKIESDLPLTKYDGDSEGDTLVVINEIYVL